MFILHSIEFHVVRMQTAF